MRNIRLILEYDGSEFLGFQRQTHGPTVQGALETALSKLLNRKTRIRAASGRTDAGVHAECQVVNFLTDSAMELTKIRRGLNGLLPKSLAVLSAEEADPNFHARYHARYKTYEYRIWNAPVRSPLREGTSYHIPQPLSLQKMREAARCLKGSHDFKSFCASDPSGKARDDTVRTVRRISIRREGLMVVIQVEADGFLYHMVRNIVGTLMWAGSGKISPRAVGKILRAKDRREAGPTAPAAGLRLKAVRY